MDKSKTQLLHGKSDLSKGTMRLCKKKKFMPGISKVTVKA